MKLTADDEETVDTAAAWLRERIDTVEQRDENHD
jgi:hypothetical protein